MNDHSDLGAGPGPEAVRPAEAQESPSELKSDLESLRAAAEGLLAERLNLEERNRRLTERVNDAELRRHKMLRHLEELAARQDGGVTMAEIYQKFAEAVGLVAAPGGGEGPGL